MRTLLGNHHLERRAGSELFTAELATSIQALGHDVAVFTFFKGAFSRSIEQQGIPVFDANDPDAIVGFNPTSFKPTTFRAPTFFARSPLAQSAFMQFLASYRILKPLRSTAWRIRSGSRSPKRLSPE